MDAEKISKLKIQRTEPGRPRHRRLGAYSTGLVLLCALAAGLYWLHDEGLLSPATSVEVISVNWVYPSQVITTFNASGYVVAQRRAAVASKGTGRLEYLAVREGSRVKDGDILARLENEDLRAERDQIQAQLAAARADRVRADTDVGIAERQYVRLKNLWEQKAVAKADYENARDQFQRSRAALESAEAGIKALEASLKRASVLIEYTVIRAPFDGVVLTKDADVGEVVAPLGSSLNAKAAVVTMADLSSLMVEADVSESSLPKVREGQPCEIQLDALAETRLSGRVQTIVPTADRTRGTVLVKVGFDQPDPRILPEMSARVSFLSRKLEEHEKQPFLAVHRDAVTRRDGLDGVFLVDGNQARWSPLTEPILSGDYIHLGGSWQVGDRVVLRPSRALKDGSRLSLPE
jgi:RND family efflux transporter MFP subunit